MSPRQGLQIYGPTITVAIGLQPQLAKLRKAENKPVPPQIVGQALIDSGATLTTIDKAVAHTLGLQPSGKAQTSGIGGLSEGFIAACSITLTDRVLHIKANLARVNFLDVTRHCKGIIALIGRDILSNMVFHYDGPQGKAYLEVCSKPAPKKPVAKKSKAPKRKPKRKRK